MLIDKEKIWEIFKTGVEYGLLWKQKDLPKDEIIVKFIRPVFEESIYDNIVKENLHEDYLLNQCQKCGGVEFICKNCHTIQFVLKEKEVDEE